MKITREQFKNIVREVLAEESEYQAFFQKALDKSGKSIPSMSDEEKKAFFDKVDAAWNGKGEKNEQLATLRVKNEASNKDGKVHFEKKLKNGNIFQVIDRDTTGMRGSQDAFLMQIVDKHGKVVKPIGSHPSLDGAKKYSNKFESINQVKYAVEAKKKKW